jgi:hypothetical protein
MLISKPLRKARKSCCKKSYRQKGVEIFSVPSSLLGTNFLKFSANNFFRVLFPNYFSGYEISLKYCVYFGYPYAKNNI